tara:strand:+ start:486 stop:710 length:225 start_codon:yes stop_codon:yes gene_type:complete
MTEKSVRQLERELKAARVRELTDHQSKITVNRDFTPVGISGNNVSKDPKVSSPVIDAIPLPSKKYSKKPNQPYY